MFRKAREVYEQQLLTPVKFGAGLPDEFLQVAMELTQTKPHVKRMGAVLLAAPLLHKDA